MVFQDVGRSLEAPHDTLLLELCEEHGVDMEAACGGFAACNTCRVRVHAGALSALDEVELPFLDRADQRLGCQARVVGDVTLSLDPGDA